MRLSQRLVLRFAIVVAIAGSPAAAPHAAGARELIDATCPIPGHLNADGTFDLAPGLRSNGTLLAGTDLRRWPDGRLYYPGGIVNSGRTSVPVDLAAGGQSIVDPEGRLAYAIDDGLGNITTWFFAAASLRKVDPSGAVTTYVYGSNGRIRSVEDPLGHVTRYSYDASGNLERVIDASSAVTSYRYNGRRVVSSTGPDGGTTSYTYDHAGRLVGVTSQGNVVTYEYGGDDLLIGVSDSSGTTRFTYDLAGRITGTSHSDGSVTRYTYDAANRITSATRPDGSTRYTYDAVGRIVRLEDSGGTVVTYEYDAAGRLIRATDETTGNTVEYSYDAAGRCLRCERC